MDKARGFGICREIVRGGFGPGFRADDRLPSQPECAERRFARKRTKDASRRKRQSAASLNLNSSAETATERRPTRPDECSESAFRRRLPLKKRGRPRQTCQQQRKCNTVGAMSDATALSRTRTVRLSVKTDRQIEAAASQRGKTTSDVIRETLEAEFSTPRETPGQWLLRTAGTRRNRKPDATFSAAYRQRHR